VLRNGVEENSVAAQWAKTHPWVKRGKPARRRRRRKKKER